MNKNIFKIILVAISLFCALSMYSQLQYDENIAQGKKVVASSEYSQEYNKNLVNDGDRNTIWGTSTSNASEWIYIDLEKTTVIDHLELEWYETYYAKRFSIYISADGLTWENISTHTSTGEIEYIPMQNNARYVGIYMWEKNNVAIGIKEFGVYRIKLPLRINIAFDESNVMEPIHATLLVRSKTELLLTEKLWSISSKEIYIRKHRLEYDLIFESEGYYSKVLTFSLEKLASYNYKTLTIALDKKFKEEPRLEAMHITKKIPFNTPDHTILNNGYLFTSYATEKKIKVYDITTPNDLVPVTKINADCQKFNIYNQYLYFVDFTDKPTLKIFDITDMQSPAQISNIDSSGGFYSDDDVLLYNDYLFNINKDSDFGGYTEVFRFKDYSTIEKISGFSGAVGSFYQNTAFAIIIDSNLLDEYIEGSLLTYDISDIHSVKKLSTKKLESSMGPCKQLDLSVFSHKNIAFADRYQYSCSSHPYTYRGMSYGYTVIDYTDPALPRLIYSIGIKSARFKNGEPGPTNLLYECIDVTDRFIVYQEDNYHYKVPQMTIVDIANTGNRRTIHTFAEKIIAHKNMIYAFDNDYLTIITD